MDREDLYYQLTHTKLVKQDSDNRDLEGKAARSIAFAAAILGASVALGILPEDMDVGKVVLCNILAYIAFTSPAVVSLSALFTLWPRKWRDDPLIDRVGGYIADKQYKPKALVEWAGNQYTNAVSANEKILKQKAWAVTISYISVVTLILVIILIRLFCDSVVSPHTLGNG